MPNKLKTKAVMAALSLVLLSGQQDVPLRAPGRFFAATQGALKGTIAGNISGTSFKDGTRELYWSLDSTQMMATGTMLSITVRVPKGSNAASLVLNSGNTRLVLETLATHVLSTIAAEGRLEVRGSNLLRGKFSLSSTDKGRPLTLTGTFDQAPVVPGLD